MDELLQNDAAFIERLNAAVETGGSVHWQQFARLTGTDERRIKSAWAAGRLPSSPGNGLPVREGLVALASLGGLRKHNAPMPDFLIEAEHRARGLLGLPAREPPVGGVSDDELSVADKLKIKHLATKIKANEAQAEKIKLQTAIKRGDYVLKSEVELDAATTATQVSVALMQLPARLSGMCANLPAEQISQIVTAEVARIIESIQQAAFTGDWEGLSHE